jgi:hypothetical protein
MGVANALAFYKMATITAVNSFIVKALEWKFTKKISMISHSKLQITQLQIIKRGALSSERQREIV